MRAVHVGEDSGRARRLDAKIAFDAERSQDELVKGRGERLTGLALDDDRQKSVADIAVLDPRVRRYGEWRLKARPRQGWPIESPAIRRGIARWTVRQAARMAQKIAECDAGRRADGIGQVAPNRRVDRECTSIGQA